MVKSCPACGVSLSCKTEILYRGYTAAEWEVWNARWSKDEWAAYHQANKTGQENDEPSGGSASTLGAGKGKGVGGASSSEAAATQVASSTMLECSETREGVEQGSPERAAKRRRSPA